jgi:xanthine dehydrogenase accessory factor
MEAPLVVHEDGRASGSLGDASLDAAAADAALAALARGVSTTRDVAGRQLFLEVYPSRLRLVVIGAVPVAMALTRLARELGYETVVIDGRASFATRERFPDVDRLLVAWPDDAADEIGLGPADAVAVLSHDPKFDDPAIEAALSRGCRYVGAIGSRKTQLARRVRLLERGVTAGQLERLRAPIGLDLGGFEPRETALSIMAEVVAARHGGSGLAMRSLGEGSPGPRVRALDSATTQNHPA